MATNGDSRSRILSIWFDLAGSMAVVSGALSLVILMLLTVNHVYLNTADPLDSEELARLKAELLNDPKNEQIKAQIRELDFALRRSYFRRQRMADIGASMLLGCVSLFMLSLKSIIETRKKGKRIPGGRPERGYEERMKSMTRQGLYVVGALLIVALLAAWLSADRLLEMPKVNGDLGSLLTEESIRRNWHRFRGPGGLGISHYDNIPEKWDGETGEGILWKSAVPLPGENSPIVWEDRVFITGATEEKRQVYCYDADTGELLWTHDVVNVPFSATEVPEVMEDTGFAAPTATTDGRRVFAIFANGDLVAVDFNGNRVWATSLGIPDNIYGHSSSLLAHGNRLIVLYDQADADAEISEIIAYDCVTGDVLWRTPRAVPNSWATPIVIDTGTREEIITVSAPWVIAYDPETGAEFWRAKCLDGDVAPSPIYADGLVYAANIYSSFDAIRPGGSGDVTDTHIVWTSDVNLPDICSPVSDGRFVFLLTSEGILTCFDAKTGEVIWEHEFEFMFKASPSIVGDKLYLLSEEGTMVIVALEPEYREIGRSKLGEPTNATPAFLDGRIYIRGKENLYCIGN